MTEKPWADVKPGEEVRDSGGKLWTVAEFSPDRKKVRLLDVNGLPFVLPVPPGNVTLAHDELPDIPGVDETELAKHIVKSRLGGEVVADTENGKNYCPATFEHVGSFLAHLYVLHGLDVTALGDKSIAELSVIHDQDHKERKAGSRFEPHIHDDSKFKG